jgi:hypothetical protein
MGWWGGGWGNHTPQSAKDVAEAFFAGKPRKRSSCKTDGQSYWFLSSNGIEVEIARRLKDNKAVVEAVAASLEGAETWRPLEFTIRGWRTPTTSRHLNALGLKTSCRGIKSPKFWVNGRFMPDNWAGWFTVDDVQNWPAEDPKVVARAEARRAREQARAYRQGHAFVQMTGRLFE